MSTATLDEFDFTYEPVSADEIPDRPRNVPPGRPSANPHVDVLKAIAGTGEARRIRLPDPGDEDERMKLVNRHARYLRFGAHENDRSVRVWHVVDGDTLSICFQDVKYLKRKPKSDELNSQDGEGSPE